MKTTYKRLITFNSYAVQMLKGDWNEETKSTKLYKAIEVLAQRITPIIEAYNERIEDLKLEHANVDANGSLLFDDKGNYQFSKEGMKAFREAVKDFLNTETADFEPFHLEPRPDIPEAELELLTGFIYREPSETII